MNKRTAIVTGSSSGNGRAIATRLADDGYSVICFDRNRSADPNGFEKDIAHSTDELIVARGGNAIFFQGDVSNPADVEGAVKRAVAEHGRLDLYVNNAGIFAGLATIIDETEEQFDRTFAVNTKGVWLGCKYAITQMSEQPITDGLRGRIVNIASYGGLVGLPAEPAYCASKGAVISLTRQLAVDFGPSFIAVNAVCPGFIETGMVRGAVEIPEMISQIDSTYPWAARGKPQDVAKAVAFLASDESSFVHGSIMTVDGGASAS